MPELADLTLEHFSALIGEPFRIQGQLPSGEPVTVELSLADAEALGPDTGNTGRSPFSLVFAGPMETMLGQGIHRLEHVQLETLEVFLVPIQPMDGRARYQAIFN